MILVQSEARVDPANRAAFEEQGREGHWSALQHFGAQMIAYGTWAFGGPDDVVVTSTVYQDLDHWAATRRDGAYYRDPAILDEIRDLLPKYADRDGLVRSSSARLLEIDEQVSRPEVFRRGAGQRLASLPPTFGRGSIISERTLEIAEGQKDEFRRLSAKLVWPWLESQGGRAIAFGWDLMGSSTEVFTWFAFTSAQEWYRFARPQSAHAPTHIADAYRARANLVKEQRGRLLVIGTDWGAHPV